MLRNDWKDWMEPDDMVCANCEHWKEAAKVAIPMDDGFMERRLCRHAEFYGDAGAGAVTLVAPESDCIHAGTCAFLPGPAYLRRIAREADRPCDDYGVRPGRDCPGTLVPLPWICRGRNGRERRALS